MSHFCLKLSKTSGSEWKPTSLPVAHRPLHNLGPSTLQHYLLLISALFTLEVFYFNIPDLPQLKVFLCSYPRISVTYSLTWWGSSFKFCLFQENLHSHFTQHWNFSITWITFFLYILCYLTLYICIVFCIHTHTYHTRIYIPPPENYMWSSLFLKITLSFPSLWQCLIQFYWKNEWVTVNHNDLYFLFTFITLYHSFGM